MEIVEVEVFVCINSFTLVSVDITFAHLEEHILCLLSN